MKDCAYFSSVLSLGFIFAVQSGCWTSSHYSQSPGDMMADLRHEATRVPGKLGNVASHTVPVKTRRK